MIRNAKDTPLSESALGLPDVSTVVESFMQPVTMSIIYKENSGGYIQEREVKIPTKAARFPAKENLAIRADGQTSWKWWTILLPAPCRANTDDVFVMRGVRYRVMEKNDWSDNGYVELNCIEDINPSVTNG